LQFDPDYGPAYLELGRSLFNIGKIQSAQIMFEKSVKLSGEDPKTHLNLGLALVSQGNFQEAINHFEHAYSIDKNDFDILLSRGSCFFDLRKINLAVENYIIAIEMILDNRMFTTVIDRFTTTFESILYKAVTNYLEKQGIKYDELFDNVEKKYIYDYKEVKFSPIEKIALLMICFPAKDCAGLMQRFPSVFIKKLAEIMTGLSDIKLMEKKNIFKEFLMMVEWNQIIKIESEEARKYYNLGRSFMERSNMELAIAQFKKALRIDPNYIETRKELGFAFAKSGQIDAAIIEWERVIALGLRDVDLHKKLGDAYAKQGKLLHASNEWKKANALERSNGEVRGN